MIGGKKYDGLAVDIWSIGIILYVMICGYLPFEASETTELCKRIIKGEYEVPEYLSDDVKDLLKNILMTDPKCRYRINDIKNHRWYQLVKPKTNNKGIFVGCAPIYIYSSLITELSKYNIDPKYAKQCIATNRHNNVIAMYYLLLKKYKTKGKDLNNEECKNELRLAKNEVKCKWNTVNKNNVTLRNENAEYYKRNQIFPKNFCNLKNYNKHQVLFQNRHTNDVLRANSNYYSHQTETQINTESTNEMYNQLKSRPNSRRSNNAMVQYNPRKTTYGFLNIKSNLTPMRQGRFDSSKLTTSKTNSRPESELHNVKKINMKLPMHCTEEKSKERITLVNAPLFNNYYTYDKYNFCQGNFRTNCIKQRRSNRIEYY